MKIRKAKKEDCQAIMELVNELAVYEKEPDAVTVSMEHFVESGFGDKPVWKAFVVTSASPNPSEGGGIAMNNSMIGGEIGNKNDDVIFGFALYYIRYSTWKGQRMYLEDFYVTEKMRGSGAGKLLFDRLIEECKEKKFSGLVWQVLDWNEPAINFYKKYPGVKFDEEWVNCSMEF
jgi:L-amino acid N-acyltransferase YncA